MPMSAGAMAECPTAVCRWAERRGGRAGRPDLAFIEMMIPHIQGAVAMSRELLETTSVPSFSSFARNIIRNQERRIAQMESWKRSWGAGSK